MVGCLLVGVLVVVLFVVVPWPLWPVLIIGLVIVFAIAAALGLPARRVRDDLRPPSLSLPARVVDGSAVNSDNMSRN